jgi:hypothetical protein
LLLLLLLLLEEKCLLVLVLLLLLLDGELRVAAVSPPATAAVVHVMMRFLSYSTRCCCYCWRAKIVVVKHCLPLLLAFGSVGLSLKRRVEVDLLFVVLQRLGLPAHFLPLPRPATAAIAPGRPRLRDCLCLCVCGVCVLGETPSVFMMECYHQRNRMDLCGR